MPSESRSIATRLSENEIATLNLKLHKDHFDTVGDLVRHYINSSLSINDSNIEKLAARVSEIVSLKLASKHTELDFTHVHTALSRQ